MLHNLVTDPKDIDINYGLEYGGMLLSCKSVLMEAVASTHIAVYKTTDTDGTTLAYWGLTPLRGGVAELWMFKNKEIDRGMKVARAAKDVVEKLLGCRRYFRLEMAVSDDLCKWAEFLGFTKSHVCVRYDGVSDQTIYVKEAQWLAELR